MACGTGCGSVGVITALAGICDPENIQMEFRIYQNDDIMVGTPEGELIKEVMDKIVYFDKVIDRIKNGEI